MDATATPAENTAPMEKGFWRRLGAFSREIWDDHDFWIRALAVKGGASAIVIAVMVGVSYVVALPFLLASALIAACGGLVALGLAGIFLGGSTAWNKLKDMHSKAFSGPAQKRPSPPGKSLGQKLLEFPRLRRLAESPPARTFLNSRAWRTARVIARKQQDLFLTGMAGGGSIFMGTLSVLTLMTQVAVLPVVAVGSLLTFTTVVAVGGLASGGYGLYLSVQKLLHPSHAHARAETGRTDDVPPRRAPAPAPAPAFAEAAAAEKKPSPETSPVKTSVPPPPKQSY